MKKKYIFSLLVLLLPFYNSCNKIEDSNTYIGRFGIHIRFQSPTGINIADSLHLCEEESFDLSGSDDTNMKVEIIRKSDGKSLIDKYSDICWAKTDFEHSYARIFSILGNEEVNTLLHMDFTDNQVWGGTAKKHNDVYQINLKSLILFNDTEIHTIKIYINVYGYGNYSIDKCEYDGSDITTPTIYGNNKDNGYLASNIGLKIIVNR